MRVVSQEAVWINRRQPCPFSFQHGRAESPQAGYLISLGLFVQLQDDWWGLKKTGWFFLNMEIIHAHCTKIQTPWACIMQKLESLYNNQPLPKEKHSRILFCDLLFFT